MSLGTLSSLPKKAARIAGEIGHVGRELVERATTRVRMRGYPSASWYWPILEQYRDSQGRTLEESELNWIAADQSELFVASRKEEYLTTKKWMSSPRPAADVDHVVHLIESHFPVDGAFTYLEFGACFGTTISQVMSRFPNARGIGVEFVPARYDVVKYTLQQKDAEWNLVKRVELLQGSILKAPLRPDSIDVVFMDTNHVFPDEYNYVKHLLDGGFLRKGFLFIGDDPLHTGTDETRRYFIEKHGGEFKVITHEGWNLWWFYRPA